MGPLGENSEERNEQGRTVFLDKWAQEKGSGVRPVMTG